MAEREKYILFGQVGDNNMPRKIIHIKRKPRYGAMKKTKKAKRSKRRLISPRRMQKVRQTSWGKSQDKELKAMRPGRRSSESGRKYTERRSNRSDTRKQHY
jgi:hypothetical protein